MGRKKGYGAVKTLVILLTKSKLVEKLGTQRTEDKEREEEQWMEPLPEIEDKEPSATRTLSLPEQGM